MTSRSYCFTLNNPSSILDFSTESNVRYAIWQKESGENGTQHYQGYIELKKSSRLSAMKKIIPTAHFEIRRGTRDEARDYCRKEESRIDGPWEYGDWISGSGARLDLQATYKMLKEGKTDAELLELNPTTWIKYYRGIREARQVLATPRDWPMTVHYYYGKPGTGKTRQAHSLFPDAYWVQRASRPTGWWDGYNSQSTLIIDDFYGWLSFDFLLRLLDRYPLMLETKGGQVQLQAKVVVITSNKHPGELYNYEKCDFNALKRRITNFWFFSCADEPADYDTDWDDFLSDIGAYK